MRFWQKIFFSTLILFIAAFDIGAYLLVSYAYDFSLDRETGSAANEQVVILTSVKNNLQAIENIMPELSYNQNFVKASVQSLADYYEDQGVYLALYSAKELLFANGPEIPTALLTVDTDGAQKIQHLKTDGMRYLHVASCIPGYPDYTLVYSRDISALDEFRYNISRVFLYVSTAVFLGLGIVIFFLIRRLTRPIRQLNQITAEIAEGDYEKRVDIRRKDELGELGSTFNIMADSVEKTVNQLTETTAEKQQFIDNLAHELKTPMTSILGYAEFLQNAAPTEEARITAAGNLYSAAFQLKNLSEKLLELTYLRTNQIGFEKIKVERLFSSLEKLVLPTLKKRELSLETEAEIRFLSGDETLLLSLLVNLVENAARASEKGAVITVRAYMEADRPILSVTDRGCGMSEEEVKKITAPFYRVDKSRSRSFGGVGLGLSIAAQIADLHAAELKISSEQGKGTTVQLIFTT